MNTPFKVHHVDTGFGKVVYQTRNKYGEKIYYAIAQENMDKFTIYRVCRAYEPQWPVQMKAHARLPLTAIFELPKGDTQLERDVYNWIIDQSLTQRLKEAGYELPNMSESDGNPSDT